MVNLNAQLWVGSAQTDLRLLMVTATDPVMLRSYSILRRVGSRVGCVDGCLDGCDEGNEVGWQDGYMEL